MKYLHKCAFCGCKADKKYRGEWFCGEHAKMMRRLKIDVFLGKERLIWTLAPGVGVYRDIVVKLK